MTNPHIVSRHFLRRRARKKLHELLAAERELALFDRRRRYRVQRGPFRWFVVKS